MANSEPSDVLIVGGGIAGLSLTLQLPGNARITLIAKAALDEGASLYAQGGISPRYWTKVETRWQPISRTPSAPGPGCVTAKR